MCVYKRGGIYHYDFILNGKRYRGSTKQTNEQRARRYEADEMANAKLGRLPSKKSPVLRDLWDDFNKHYLEHSRLDPDTKRYYRNGWRMIDKTRLAGVRVSQITNSDVDALGPAEGSGFNINNARRTVRRLLSFAVEQKYIPLAPKISLVEEHGRRHVFSKEQQDAFLKIAPQPLKDVAMLIFDAGMRPDEVYRMRWENINWTDNTIFIPEGKTPQARRYVPMSERCTSSLLARREALRGDKKLKNSPWVFASKRSRSGYLSPLPCNRQFSDCREKLGLGKEYVLYTARHTFGTEVMEMTGNPKLVMEVMGHSEMRTTGRYVHSKIAIVGDLINRRNGSEVIQ